MSKIALVLGAAGFIGRHVCHRLATDGMTVHGIGHGAWDEQSAATWGIAKWLEADISLDSMTACMGELSPSVVVHCAGGASVAASFSDPFRDHARTVVTTAAVVEFARRQPIPPRVVLASSAAVYGDVGSHDADEDALTRPVSPYGVHKLAAEQLCAAHARHFNVPVSVIRLFSVYGEGLRKQLLWDAMNKLSQGQYRFLGTGMELRDWIHVEDAARLLVLAATTPQPTYALYNGGHQHATTHSLLSRLACAAGRDATPGFSGESHTGNPSRLTAARSRACETLGWEPMVDLDSGLTRYAAWFSARERSE